MAVLEVQGLVKSFGSRRVVDGVDFYVDSDEIVVLLGPNGAGKSTSFRMTCGMTDPDKGKVFLNGKDVTSWPMYRRCREGGMGYLPQDTSIFRKLTVEQNLLGIMELLGMNWAERKRRCDELLEQFGITHIRKSMAGSASGGEKRRLEIARCLITNPEIILLDEPYAGVDPVTVQAIQETIRGLKDRGIAVLITDHSAQVMLEIADRGYVIEKGKVLCEGKPKDLLEDPRARAVYFGDGIRLDSSDGQSAPPPKPSPANPPPAATPPRENPARVDQPGKVRPVPRTKRPSDARLDDLH